MPELLSPAGNLDCLEAAVANGADAVYLGGTEFNARINAGNFSPEQLGRAVTFAHQHGVSVYLTLNTLVKNFEMGRFFEALSRAYSRGIDGVIIQHVSLLETIKKAYPGLKVFISTQAAISNSASARLVKSADRIILPRELRLEEIKKIISSGVSVEVFVHGALCFGYSGLCLFSSFVSNRSGNRGQCAQICRQRFDAAYPLSTRELCLVRRLPDLIQAGVSGFKIEGRMRSPLYVAVATRLYRKAIDSALAGKFEIPARELSEIEVVFNRRFTKGFTVGDTEILSTEKPMNRGALLGTVRDGEIALARAVSIGDGVGVWSDDLVAGAIVKEILVLGSPVNSAKAGDTARLLLDGLSLKDGNTVYLTSSKQISLKPDFTVKRQPISTARRQPVRVSLPPVVPRRGTALKLLARVYSLSEAMETSLAGADIVFYDIFARDFPSKGKWPGAAVLGAYLPRIMTDAELTETMARVRRLNPAAILTGDLGIVAHRHEFKSALYLDYSVNCFNDQDSAYFLKLGATPMASPELSIAELTKLRNKEIVLFCHGDIVLVNTRIGQTQTRLTDDKGLVFPVRKEAGYWQILNSQPFGLFNDVRKLRTLGFCQFFIDKAGESAHLVTLYRQMLRQEVPDRHLRRGYTSGHLYRPVG